MAIRTRSGPYEATILYGTRVDGAVIPAFTFLGPLNDPEFLAICAWLAETGIPFAPSENPVRESLVILPRDADDLLTLTLRLPVEIPVPNVIIGDIETLSLCTSNTPIAASSTKK